MSNIILDFYADFYNFRHSFVYFIYARQHYCLTRPTTPLGQPKKLPTSIFFVFYPFQDPWGKEAHSSILPNLDKKF